MAIDINNEKVRRYYHNTVLRTMAKLERVVQKQLKPMINRQFIDSAKLIEHGIQDIDFVVSGQRKRLRTILRNHYRRVANVAGRQAIEAFDFPKSMGDSFWQEIDAYVRENTGVKVSTMLATSVLVISSTIKRGVYDGLSHKEIAKRLRKKGKSISSFQALRIARTETHGMYNAATEASVRDTGLNYKRVWSSTLDARTRRRKKGSPFDHWSVDGQERDQDEPFEVSGEKLMYPGDPRGSAGNIINCRCVLLYEKK